MKLSIDEIKTKMNLLYKKQREFEEVRDQLDQMKADTIPLLKSAGLVGTRFDFPDKTVKYKKIHDYSQITQKMITTVLKDYPIDQAEFIKKLLKLRTIKEREYIEFQRK